MNNKYSRWSSIWSCFLGLFYKVNSFWIHLCYFVSISFVGYLALRLSKPRSAPYFRPKNLDLFFTSVSAMTNSSMSTVEMEVFSNFQLIVMIILMSLGGEVFMSWLELHIKSKIPRNKSIENDKIELGLASFSSPENENSNSTTTSSEKTSTHSSSDNPIRILCSVILGYLFVFHVAGISLSLLYIRLVGSAKEVLKTKGLQRLTFSVFIIVSNFSNTGFVPTNENMIVFKKNSGLLWILIPQVLLGKTLYPSCLRLVIWVLYKITRRAEFEYVLRNYKEMGYPHLFSSVHSYFLGATVFGFLFMQFVLFCSLEWNSEAMDGLNFYQKVVGSLFEVVNSRYTGESVFDLSILSSAVLVLFVVMMYLPPYTLFLPRIYQEKDSGNCKPKENEKKGFVESLILSQLSYLVMAIIIICITERDNIENDPLNFNVLNITLEVISAYGNVGFSTGYSCKRQLKTESSCMDTWHGFVGRWSTGGKLMLIIIMFFGKLKKFNMKGGKSWKLS
ncbi:hypothetical protein Patl1_12309 [Pistacia atlantica]|uniref:Uncharacterized protein n=1 Tax=Pistacia atlantica TaxID=434234 RepID=A0ACC1A6Y6_9ROSI|nr:hypothetical protein Patl1_12309 [Pistacia atlantica]